MRTEQARAEAAVRKDGASSTEAACSFDAFDDAWLDRIVRRRNREMHDGTRRVAKKRLLPAYLKLREQEPELLASWGVVPGDEVDAALIRLLRAKPRRTASGVATLTVLTKPWPCRGACIYCPNDVRMPKSYLANEPACQRAERCFFDPYLQVVARLSVLADMGHVTDKVELIVLGGTWCDYPRDYRLWFMRELFCALNDMGMPEVAKARARERRAWYGACGLADGPDELRAQTEEVQRDVDAGRTTYNEAHAMLYETAAWECIHAAQRANVTELEDAQRENETAAHRCVGLVVETTPDTITPDELAWLRRLGCTKVQMGIQSLDPDILRRCGRHADADQVRRAFSLLRLFGFKQHVHMMANLPGATPETDAAEYRELMENPAYLPDELKLYPCALVESAALTREYERGAWQPYAEEELISLLANDVRATRPFTRISRMIRDISATDIIAGNKKTNLRQLVEERVDTADEMRLREIGTADVCMDGLTLQTVRYETCASEERFLQWVTPQGRLAGFLRLSLPREDALEELLREAPDVPLAPQTAMIREVHIYGKVAALHAAGEAAQHTGLGRQLVEEAFQQAQRAGYRAVNVISAVGTRGYYRSLGFEDAGLYQRRILEGGCDFAPDAWTRADA